MANYFMPSEVARLILGYLIDRGLSKSLKIFIQECPDLGEFYQMMKSGRVPPTTIMGQSLMDILNEFAELKLKAVLRKARQTSAKKAREQETANVDGGMVDISTPISRCRRGINTEAVPVSTPRHRVVPARTSLPAYSEIINPEVISAASPIHVTTPRYTSVTILSGAASPEIIELSLANHVANPEDTDALPATSAGAIAEVESMPDVLADEQATSVLADHQAADVSVLSAAQTNLETQVQQEPQAKHSAGPSHAKTAAEENTDLLDWLLEDTNFHEKLAQNINKALRGPSQPKKKVGTSSEANKKDLASMINRGRNINHIIERTESDPTFQNFLQLFQQGTAVPLSQFNVPEINIASEVTDGQPANGSLPTASKRNSPEAVPDSGQSVSVEPASCQGDVSTVASACSVTSQPTNLLHTAADQSSLLNPCSPERFDQVLPSTSGACETLQIDASPSLRQAEVDSSPSLKQSQTDDYHQHGGPDLGQNNLSPAAKSPQNLTVMKEYGSQSVIDPKLPSSPQLVTSGFYPKCVTSDLNSAQNQAVSSELTACKNSVISENLCPSVQDSSLPTGKITAQSSYVPTNENSLTVFSLIEKSIAEMNGEEFVHRSVRNLSSQTTSSVETHTHSSIPNRDEAHECLSAVAVCSKPSREDICCKDVLKTLVDSDASTYNCQDSNFKTGPHNIDRPTSISLDVNSTQNASANLAGSEIKENIGAFWFGSTENTSNRTTVPDEDVLTGVTAVCNDSVELPPAFDNKQGESGLHIVASCQNDYTAGKNERISEIDTAASFSAGKDTCVNQEQRQVLFLQENVGQAVVETHQSHVGVSGLKNICTEIKALNSLPEDSEQDKTNSSQSPGNKNKVNSCSTVYQENYKQCSKYGDQSCTLTADCPVVRETEQMVGVEETETNARNICLSDVSNKEACVDNHEPSCMSPPVRQPDRLQPTVARRHTKKTCINKQTEVKRSQSLCDCSAGSTLLDGQISTVHGNSGHAFFEKQPGLTSPPYFPVSVADSSTFQQLSASICPQTSCCSLSATLAHAPIPGSPNCSQICSSSVNQTLQMTPPQGRQPYIQSTEKNQILPKTAQRRVIAFHSEQSPFIPDHCKKNPSRRIAPKEVDYSTPSPLQDCPSSPLHYMVDVSSQPNSPHNSREGVLRPFSNGKTLPPLNGHTRINSQRSVEALGHSERSLSCSGAQSQTTEGQQKVKTPDDCLSHLDQLGIKLPPSPSKRKPRRVNPVQLSASVSKDWSGLTRSSSFVLHGGFSPAVDDARIVSSTSDITTSSEAEAFRQLKSFLSSSYSKPQPRQEITSTDQKTGASKCAHSSKSHNKHKGRGKKNALVKENSVLTITPEANDSNMSKKPVLMASNCDNTRREHGSAESVLSREDLINKTLVADDSGGVKEQPIVEAVISCKDLINKTLNTDDTECVKGQPTVNLCLSDGGLPVKNNVHKVQCLHNAAQHSMSPCSRDSDMSFAPVGIMECFPIESDKPVQKLDSCKMAASSSSSLSPAADCESRQNIPCLTKSKDDASKVNSNTFGASEKVCNYENDTSGTSKVYIQMHKRSPQAEGERHSRLASVDADKVSVASSNCMSQVKSTDGHYSPPHVHGTISAERPTNNVESNEDRFRNITAFSNSQAITSPTVSIVTNQTFTNSTSTVKSLPCVLSAPVELTTTSAGSVKLNNTDPAVSKECHFTQLQLQPCGQHKNHDSGGSPPPTSSPSKLSNVSDSVADAVCSLLSLVSRVDGKSTTSLVSFSDGNLSSNPDYNQVYAANKLPRKNTTLPCHSPLTATSEVMSSSLLQVPMVSSDVSLPSFVSSSLRLAHDIQNPFEVPTSGLSPVKHSNNNWAGHDAIKGSETVCAVYADGERFRPCSPCSVSLLRKAMAESEIPFEGSNFTSLDTWTNTVDAVCHNLPVSYIQTPDVIAAFAAAHATTESKKGRKSRSKFQKPNHQDVVKILPSLGVHGFDLVEKSTVEQPAPSNSFVKILPRVSEALNADLGPQMADTQEQGASLNQIQMIPSANGPIIIIPPDLQGIIQNLLSENKEQVSDNENLKPAKSLPTSCNWNIPNSQASIPTVTALSTEILPCQPQSEGVAIEVARDSGNCSSYMKCTSAGMSVKNTAKLEEPSASLQTAVEAGKRDISDSSASCDGEELLTTPSFPGVRKIAVRRRVDFTHLRSSKKGQTTKATNKFETVADSSSTLKLGHSSNVMVTKDIQETNSVSFSQAPDIKRTVNNMSCKVKRNCKDYAVHGEKTKVACEVKKDSEDCVVQGGMTEGICEMNRQVHEEISMCEDTAKSETCVSVHEHKQSASCAKSSDYLKPCKNNKQAKAVTVNQKQSANINTIEDSRRNKTALPSCDRQNSVSCTNSSPVKSVGRKRKRKEMKLDDQAVSKCKRIKLQVQVEKPEIKEHHLCSNRKSVRMVVDYTSGETIVVGNLPHIHSEAILTPRVEHEEQQPNILHPRSHLKLKNKSVLQKLSGKNNISICSDNTQVNKCITEGDQKLETVSKISTKPGGCQYVASMQFHSLFSIFDNINLQGNQSTQPSLVPVDGSAKQSPQHPRDKSTDSPPTAQRPQGHSTSRNGKSKTATPCGKATSEHKEHTITDDHTVATKRHDPVISRNRKSKTATPCGKATSEHQEHTNTDDHTVASKCHDPVISRNRKSKHSTPCEKATSEHQKQSNTDDHTFATKRHDPVISQNRKSKTATPCGKATLEHQEHTNTDDHTVATKRHDPVISRNRKSKHSTPCEKATSKHQKQSNTDDHTVATKRHDPVISQNRKSKTATPCGKATSEHQEHTNTDDHTVATKRHDPVISRNRKSKHSTPSEKATSEHQECTNTSHHTVTAKPRGHASSRKRKSNTAAPCVKATSEHQEYTNTDDHSITIKHHDPAISRNRKSMVLAPCDKATSEHINTSNHTVAGISRDHAASRNKSVPTGDVQGERLSFQKKSEICNGGNDMDTASVVDVDLVSINMYDNETRNAVSALELCMRVTTQSHNKQTEPQYEASSQANIDSSVIIVEDSMCPMSNSSSPAKKSQPCNLYDVSPIKLHLPPKKRLSSEFSVSGTTDAQLGCDHDSSALSGSDSIFSIDKVTTCRSHTSSVGPSEVLQRSSNPETVSPDLETGAVCHEAWTEDSVLHSSQPAPLDCTSQTNQPALLDCTLQTSPLSSEVRDKTTNHSSKALCHAEICVKSVSEVQAVQPPHRPSIDNTLMSTDLLHEVSNEQSSLSSCSFGERHKQRCTSSSVASPGRLYPYKHGSDTTTTSSNPALACPAVNTCEPQTINTTMTNSKPALAHSAVNTCEPQTINMTTTSSKPALARPAVSTCEPQTINMTTTSSKPALARPAVSTCEPQTINMTTTSSKPALARPAVSACEPQTVNTTTLTGSAQLVQELSVSGHILGNKVDKLLKKLHKRKSTHL
ncbi:hypothetical protein BsWGS_12695 [Bradybaena similaris]